MHDKNLIEHMTSKIAFFCCFIVVKIAKFTVNTKPETLYKVSQIVSNMEST